MMELIEQSSNNSTQASAIERYWQEQIKFQHESGLSRVAYCRQYDISCHRLGYWDRKLISKSQPVAQFLPVKLNPSTTNCSTPQSPVLCSVEFKCGHQLKIHDQAVLPLLLSLMVDPIVKTII